MTIEQKLQRTKNKAGLVGGSLKINKYPNYEQLIAAHINPNNWNIEITLDENYDPIQDRRQQAYARAKKIENGLEVLLTDILSHELAHWELPFGSEKGCPYNTYHHDQIKEAIEQELPEDKKSQASYLANAFEDLMINPRIREFTNSHEGQVLFWDTQGNLSKEQGQEHYNSLYEAFVKLNIHLFGDNKDRALLKRHYSNAEEVDEAVKNIVRDLSLEENIQDTSHLFQRQNWPNMARVFARHMGKLVDDQPKERLSAFSDSNSGNQQEEQEPGNGVEQKLATKDGKEEVAYGRYKSGQELSSNITEYEQLDLIYQRLAKPLSVKVEAMSKKHSLNIAPLNYRPFDEETDNPAEIKPNRIFLDEDRITFGAQRDPLTIEAKSKVQRKSFPDFRLITLDNSGSMASGIDGNEGNTITIPWGDNSKYHYALLGLYGIEKYLQLQGIAQYIDHGMSLFSNQTRYMESSFQDLAKLRKLALSPEFGGTHLGADVLLNAVQGKESFVLSISDGSIDNWSSVKDEFLTLARENYFGHIQIGKPTQFTRDLEENGLPAFYVNSGQDLSKLMVDITKQTYKGFVTK